MARRDGVDVRVRRHPIALFGGSAVATFDFGSVSATAWFWAAFIVIFPTAGAYVLIS